MKINKDILPKWTSVITWILGFLLFCGWTDLVWGQTYTVGDTIGNFNLEICENGEGTWDYHTDGAGNVVWMNLFTSW
jgi:hypothetical protein